jgi:CheY-like chemotaxis protein
VGNILDAALPRRAILLVEDDEDTRQLLAVALESQGYDVDQAAHAAQALDRLRARRFDLVLTDYDLPGRTGAALLREAHRDGLVRGAATLVVTAHPDPEGVDEETVVRKPLDLAKFLRQVAGILEARAPRPAIAVDGGEAADAGPLADVVELMLYVSAESPSSAKARKNLDSLLERYACSRLKFTVCDLAAGPFGAEEDRVVFTPTLVKRRPEPRAWVLGDLSDAAVLADLLHMCGIEPQA